MTRPPARPRKCRHCKAPVLAGLDDELCGFPTTVDPTPLSPIGEALALLAGRTTYRLDKDQQLWRRDRWQIAGQPAGTVDRLFPHDVVASHSCGAPPLPSIESQLQPKSTTTKEANDVGTLLENIPF